jgi:hypothetical protein
MTEDEERAKAEAEWQSWVDSEWPRYLATCGGEPTKKGLVAYMHERQRTADPETQERLNQAVTCMILAKADAMWATEKLLQRLGIRLT